MFISAGANLTVMKIVRRRGRDQDAIATGRPGGLALEGGLFRLVHQLTIYRLVGENFPIPL